MTTTTIRLEDELKTRVAGAADRAGQTAHAFILDALAQHVEQAELEQEFQQLAETRWAKLLDSGKSVGWDAAQTWLEARARGDRGVRRPAARRPTR